MKRIIEKTDDGSTTLFVPELNEHYHSTKGARTESQHIFINMGLKASTATTPHILEIGFGTGLNAWLTLEEAEKSGRNVYYTGLELYPLEWQLVEQLGLLRINPSAMEITSPIAGRKAKNAISAPFPCRKFTILSTFSFFTLKYFSIQLILPRRPI